MRSAKGRHCGQVLVENGDLVAQPGVGQFVKRARFGQQLRSGRAAVPAQTEVRLGGKRGSGPNGVRGRGHYRRVPAGREHEWAESVWEGSW